MTYQQLEIDTSTPVLSWAGHDLAQQETKMAKNVASLPFVFKHVALMPDVHLGKGALVGSVIATKDAIIPAAVGVDIGCFAGDTLVPLVDGNNYPIQELAQRNTEFIVYACTPTGKIVAATATAKLTRKNTSLVKVILDNEKEIICTPDHQFMLRDGSYQEAIDLQPEISLMPFYSKVDRDGYTLISQPYSGRWNRAHWIVARSGILGDIPRFVGQRTIIHHRNFTQSDNQPNNLEFMGDRDHSAYHRSLVDRNRHWQSVEFEQRRLAALTQKAQTPAGRDYFAQRGTKNIIKYMQEQPEHFQQAIVGNGERGKNYLVAYNQSERGRIKSKEISNRLYTCEICGTEIKSPIGLHNHRKKEHKCNHKVVAVIPLDRTEDVYCLTVPEHHNFALAAGIFVHNCGMMAIQTPFRGEKLDGKLKKIRLDLEAQIPVGFEENKEISKDATNCHIDTAKDLAKLADLKLPDRDLAYFVAGTPEFQAYWRDLQWAQNYARTNRDVMMSRFIRIMEQHLNGGKKMKPLLAINCHHNYAEKEVHFGEEVYVTRKGAVRAQAQDYGIIPGSMGTKSYIVKGKGNAQSFCSCAHGAGRIMSRSMAKNTYTLDDLIAQTMGVECRKDPELLDEIPAAYKSIDKVMANQADLVEVVATLKQVVCIKG